MMPQCPHTLINIICINHVPTFDYPANFAKVPLAGSGYTIWRKRRYQKPLERALSRLTPVRTRGDCRKGISGLGGTRDKLAGWYCKPSPVQQRIVVPVVSYQGNESKKSLSFSSQFYVQKLKLHSSKLRLRLEMTESNSCPFHFEAVWMVSMA